MNIRAEVLLWAQRVMSRDASQPAHTLLEVKADATLDQVQTAFHDIARTSHPDLHRTTLDAEELELLTSAYSRVAAAYQDMRVQKMQTTKIRAIKPGDLPPLTAPTPPRTATGSMSPIISRSSTATLKPSDVSTDSAARPTAPRATTGSMRPIARPGSPTGSPPMAVVEDGPVAKASEQMNSKALVCYRKAEMALRRGDLKGAVLQLKLAIASDPQSAFLRTALAEVESEVGKA